MVKQKKNGKEDGRNRRKIQQDTLKKVDRVNDIEEKRKGGLIPPNMNFVCGEVRGEEGK